MQWFVFLIALIGSYQPQPTSTAEPSRTEKALQGFELYATIANKSAGLADDIIDDGGLLLYYRAAHFVHVYGKASPAEAIRVGAIVLQVPEVTELGARLNAGPLEVEKRESASASTDREWVTTRTAALLERKDLGVVGSLITDLPLPLSGRIRVDILNEKDRDEQLTIRWTLLVTALQSFRESSGKPTQLSDADSKAASKLAQEQLARDYMRINGFYVGVRGEANLCAHIEVDLVAKAILEWVGPALKELEGVKNLTLVPTKSGWVVVDADTGWSLRDPTIGKFSERDIFMLQKGLQARKP